MRLRLRDIELVAVIELELLVLVFVSLLLPCYRYYARMVGASFVTIRVYTIII